MFKSISLKSFAFLIPNKNDNTKQLATKLLYMFICAVIIAVIIVTSCFASSQIKSAKNQNVYKNIWYTQKSNKFVNAKKVNKDFAGWLKIEGTAIDYPVFKANNNTKYTYTNACGNKDYNGALFFDKDTKLTKQNHYVIYGNNCSDGAQFGTLEKYMSVFYYKDNPEITLNIANKESYVIFSAMVINAYDDGENFFDIYRDSFSDSANFELWVTEAKEKSIYTTSVDVAETDETLALVTTPYNNTEKRFVILARKLRDGENAATLASTATVNKGE